MNFIHKVHLVLSMYVLISKLIKVDKWDYFLNRPQDFSSFILQFSFNRLSTKPLSELGPGLLDIQIQIQAVCYAKSLYRQILRCLCTYSKTIVSKCVQNLIRSKTAS